MPDFKKYTILFAEPNEVYNALINENSVKLWTGCEAEIIPEVNGEFSMWEDSIVGRFLELEENFKIVQEWYFGDDHPEPSIVTIKLHKHPKGTSMEVRHINIPDEAVEDIIDGWESMYLEGLIEFFNDEEE